MQEMGHRAGLLHPHQQRVLCPWPHCTQFWRPFSGCTCRLGHVLVLLLRGSCGGIPCYSHMWYDTQQHQLLCLNHQAQCCIFVGCDGAKLTGVWLRCHGWMARQLAQLERLCSPASGAALYQQQVHAGTLTRSDAAGCHFWRDARLVELHLRVHHTAWLTHVCLLEVVEGGSRTLQAEPHSSLHKLAMLTTTVARRVVCCPVVCTWVQTMVTPVCHTAVGLALQVAARSNAVACRVLCIQLSVVSCPAVLCACFAMHPGQDVCLLGLVSLLVV